MCIEVRDPRDSEHPTAVNSMSQHPGIDTLIKRGSREWLTSVKCTDLNIWNTVCGTSGVGMEPSILILLVHINSEWNNKRASLLPELQLQDRSFEHPHFSSRARVEAMNPHDLVLRYQYFRLPTP